MRQAGAAAAGTDTSSHVGAGGRKCRHDCAAADVHGPEVGGRSSAAGGVVRVSGTWLGVLLVGGARPGVLSLAPLSPVGQGAFCSPQLPPVRGIPALFRSRGSSLWV